MAVQVRFVNNFILTVVETITDDDGRLQAQERLVHIHVGDIYALERFEQIGDDKFDLHFLDSGPLNGGVAHRVEGDLCEFTQSDKVKANRIAATAAGGCGGCGNK